ncbi:RagB/SusD family nutrient uptake outer membrane protein [Chitinophaga defluvii]|uniref:RagB/SusD family nutrient uptake outer membrane protein n=1 Tax=Chitinophaga defluvii TaxID=3163343 RepID=A0ABV2TBE5_9BACT
MKYSFIYRLLAGLMILTSCSKFVDIVPSPQLIISEDVFSDEQSALSALNGVYTQMRNSNLTFSNSGLTIFAALSADELIRSAPNVTYDVFYRNNIPANDPTINTFFWTAPYNILYRSNAIINGLSASTGIPADAVRRLSGEMKFIRAFTCFYLINLFGPVPLITTTDYTQNATIPRTDTTLIWRQIVTDLEEAAAALEGTATGAGTGKVRPGFFAVKALQARVHLYRKDWVAAERAASIVINTGPFEIEMDPERTFLINSTETIWEIASRNGTGNTGEATNFIPLTTATVPAFQLTPSLQAAFEMGDKRWQYWVGQGGSGTATYPYPRKYRNRNVQPVTEYNIVLRLAELYLIRAEALAMLDETDNAVKDINVIRNRAGLEALPKDLSQQHCLERIAQERRIELFAEWGHRWLDLKRTVAADTVLGAEKTWWQPYASLYPIPLNQLLYNYYLKQNNGYEQ